MSDSPLNRIPSISQLMELRPLKDLAHKVSSSTVAEGIKTYLQPYQKMAMEAASNLPYSSLQHLASEISDWILGQRSLGRPEVINASGQVLGKSFPVGPLAEEIVVQAHLRRSDYRQAAAEVHYRQEIERILCHLTGAQAAVVLKDRKAASFLIASSLSGKQAVVPRCQVSATFDGVALPKLLNDVAHVTEVGSSNQVDLAELADQLKSDSDLLLWFDRSNFDAPGSSAISSTADALAALKSSSARVWVDVGIAALTSNEVQQQLQLCSAKQAIQSGAELVVVGGGFLLGGPDCAIVVGTGQAVGALRELPTAEYLLASTPALAELEACLRIHQSQERVDDRIPVLSLLSTSIENLQLRATRLAEQLATSPWIAEAVTQTADVAAVPGCRNLDTCQVVLKPTSEGLEPLRTQLGSFPAIACHSQNDDEIVLDLRTLFPRNDAQLTDKIVPEDDSDEGSDMGNYEK